jgi:hypothetical protein
MMTGTASSRSRDSKLRTVERRRLVPWQQELLHGDVDRRGHEDAFHERRERVGVGHRGFGDREVLRGLHVTPAKLVAGVTREQLQERPLGTAVALAERMKGIHVREEMTRCSGEPAGVQTAQTIGPRDLAEDVSGGMAQVSSERERAGALRDVDGAQLAGPVVDRPEQAAMHSLESGEVATLDGGHRDVETDLGVCGDLALDPGQLYGIGETEPIAEDARRRVDVRVGQRSGVVFLGERQRQGLSLVLGVVDLARQESCGELPMGVGHRDTLELG